MSYFKSLKSFINKKRCQKQGHQWVAGLTFRNAKIQGSGQVCQRCGIYETITKPIEKLKQ